MPSSLSQRFDFEANNATWRGEITGGATTFLTLAYIIFVQPAILQQAGMDFGAVMVATCISAAIATLIMGLAANYPIALAPGMGENFYFVFGIVIASGLHWTEALSAAFYAGVIFVLLSVLRARDTILHAIPDSLKTATGIGIGLFIAFIGLHSAGIVEPGSGAIVRLGSLTAPPALLALGGLLVTCVLMVRGVKGAIFWGVLLTGIAATVFGLVRIEGIVSTPPSIAPTFAKLDWTPHISANFIAAVFILLFMDVIDTIGSLAAVGKQAGYFVEGKLPRANRAFIADSLGTVFGAVAGTSTVTSYIESTAGIAAGARTGVAAIIVAAGFVLSLFFAPLVKAFGGGIATAGGQTLYPVTAPALIIVGALMARLAKEVPWDDFTEALPAFMIIIGIPLTYSPADGLSLGFIAYPVVKIAAGRFREIHPVMIVLALAAIVRYFLI
jgi:AGZA family xanthine/uracil permease-like MFS transporter